MSVRVQATALNLVAFVEDGSALERIDERTESIAKKHAAKRIIFDATQQGGKPEDGVHFGVAHLSAAQLGSLLRDMLAPNVHSILFWAGKLLEDNRLAELSSIVRNTIVDSSRNAAPTTALAQLAARASGDWPLHDLAYMRLLPWQDLVALFFDDPDLVSELDSIDEVAVTAGSLPEAYYLVGWLASRLHWEPCGENEFCNAAGRHIGIQIAREGHPRRVKGIWLRSQSARFSASLDPRDENVVCLAVAGDKAKPQTCAPLHDVDIASLIEHAIVTPQSDAVFLESLQMAAQLLKRKPPAP